MVTWRQLALQVPFISWLGEGAGVRAAVAAAAPRVTPWLFGEAGRQFFLGDSPLGDGSAPLLVGHSPHVADRCAQWRSDQRRP